MYTDGLHQTAKLLFLLPYFLLVVQNNEIINNGNISIQYFAFIQE